MKEETRRKLIELLEELSRVEAKRLYGVPPLEDALGNAAKRLRAILAEDGALVAPHATSRAVGSADPMTRPVPDALRALRIRAGLTLEQLAYAIGMDASALSRVERGYRKLDIAKMHLAREICVNRRPPGASEP